VHVIPGVDLDILDGEFVVFVGPSGCGKSTLLRLIAGLEDTTSGIIAIDGKDTTSLPPAKRGLAMVFQSYALYLHMTVRKNISFPMKMAGMSEADQARKVDAAAKVLNLSSYLDRRPGQLSGGQRQRVAIGRAIVREPAAFLFDEPLSNLDASLRVTMRQEITELHQTLKTTMIYVTHDQVEAMTMADKIVVLNAGRVEQVGSPKMNLIAGAEAAQHGATTIGVRPEHIEVGTGPGSGIVALAEHLGSDTFLKVNAGDLGTMTVRASGEVRANYGDRIQFGPQTGKIHRFGADGKNMA